IAVPLLDMERLPPVGEEARLFVWLYHREDQMRLFGFMNPERRSTFLELMKVDGIGPRQAIKILSGIGQEELEAALENEDIARLEAVPGLGKKTAQKMILALKGKLARPELAAGTPLVHEELVNALADMGYDRKAAAEAVAAAAAQISAEEAAVVGGAAGAAGIAGAAGRVNPALSLSAAEREKRIFKQAIVILSSQ
ncbi:MAG: Holliday junction branch migration protein RuvA, partial [Treponema sp.]|nr:Holliday junction branch migration protein RuvA [Treponema sp.]